jgi:large subunit ribosomal protein LP0
MSVPAIKPKDEAKAKKSAYMKKFVDLLETYPRAVLVTVDNIGSHHMQKIRVSLRGRAVLIMGKNTLMRKSIKDQLSKHPEWEALLPVIRGNVGFVFTKDSLFELQTKLLESRVPAQAKAGIVAPQDVVIPKQVTTLEPTKTSFFAALDIATKITRGCVEILNDVHLCKEGEKVGSSEAALLQMLDLRPFTYGLKLTNVLDDGWVWPARHLNTTSAELFKAFAAGVSNVAALSLGLNYPTLPAFPHAVMNAYKNLVAVCLGTNYLFDQARSLKERVENPDAFAVAAPVVTATTTTTPTPVAAPPPEEESEEEEEEEMTDLFSF